MNDFEIEREIPTPEILPPEKSRLNRVFPQGRFRTQWIGAGFHRGPHRRGKFEIVMWSWFAATIDALVIFCMDCLCTLIFLKIEGSDHTFKIYGLEIFALLSLMNIFIYMLSLRAWFGFSVGEWACNLRLGAQRLQKNPYYMLKVFLRVVLVLSTGIFFFPLASLFYRKDILGQLIGLRLTQLKPLPKR